VSADDSKQRYRWPFARHMLHSTHHTGRQPAASIDAPILPHSPFSSANRWWAPFRPQITKKVFAKIRLPVWINPNNDGPARDSEFMGGGSANRDNSSEGNGEGFGKLSLELRGIRLHLSHLPPGYEPPSGSVGGKNLLCRR